MTDSTTLFDFDAYRGTAPMASEPQPLVIGYTNWRGEWSLRRVIPIGAPYWGSTDYHPEPQWLQNMQDLDKGAERVFALKDIGARPTPGEAITSNAAPEWLPIDTAPKDGELLLLLVTDGAVYDGDSSMPTENEIAWRTIGHNNRDHDGEDRWQFAGWCWDHDHFTQGNGVPVRWQPMPPNPAAEATTTTSQPDPTCPTCGGTGQERFLLPNTMPDTAACACMAPKDQDHG